ncbi:hypothetical protein [Bernardetia sp. MNP-M8]|uniref:hypothetical protein n=1 Tax=Bernardetia sp. MNP-M8 TaxID=3127470 RepID=UPI0030D0B207
MTYQNYLDKYKSVNFSTANFDKEIIEVFNDGHAMITELAENGLLEDEELQQDINEHYDFFNEMLKKLGSSTKTKKENPPKKSSVKKGAAPKKTPVKKTPVQKEKKEKKATTRKPKQEATPKKQFPSPKNESESQLAITFVKSFLLMLGKEKERKNVQNLLNRINKAASSQQIRAKSVHSEPINYIAKSLVDALNSDYNRFRFSLDKVGSEVLEPYMNAKEALPNVLLRSFYNSQNKKFSKTQANLLKRLEKIEDTDNPFSKEITEAIKVLKKAEQNNSTIQATKTTLRGLEGICKKKASLNGFEKVSRKAVIAGAASGAIGGMIGTVLQQSLAGVDEYQDKFLSGEEILASKYTIVPMSKEFVKSGYDGIPTDATIFVYGKPKNGKSTYCMILAKALSMNGKVLYVGNEQIRKGKAVKSFKDLVQIVGTNPNITYSQHIPSNLKGFPFVILDSVNTLDISYEEWLQLRKENPDTFFVLVSHVSASGRFRGTEQMAHDVDVLVEVKNGRAYVTQGRYGTGEFQIFEEREGKNEENEYEFERNENYLVL